MQRRDEKTSRPRLPNMPRLGLSGLLGTLEVVIVKMREEVVGDGTGVLLPTLSGELDGLALPSMRPAIWLVRPLWAESPAVKAIIQVISRRARLCNVPIWNRLASTH